jgi:hypothetical protein
MSESNARQDPVQKTHWWAAANPLVGAIAPGVNDR